MTDATLPVPETPPPRSSASWMTWLWQVSHTPLSDVLRGRLTCSLDMAHVIAAAHLPAESAALIQSVVRGTRLWRSERVDVARELCGHFRDGLDAGASAETLNERFGDPKLAAGLIRKSRIRCRPYSWHAWRYSLWSVAALVVLYVGLSAKFFLSKPTITRHYIEEFNEQTRAIPEDQWAWPLYRQALKARMPYPKPEAGESNEFGEGWWPSDIKPLDHDSLPWKQMRTYVEENQAALELIRQAAKQPARGILYGDPLDHPQGNLDPDPPVFETLLTQSQEMRTFARLLTADATLAIADQDGERLTADLRALLGVAEHSLGFSVIEDLIAAAILQMTMVSLRDALDDAPQLLTNEQLVEVAHRLAVFHGGGTIRYDLRGEQWMIEDVLQRCYTDNGRGDGTLTPEGMTLLARAASINWSEDSRDPQTKTVAALLAPLSMLRAMGRKESKELTDRLFTLSQTAHRGPLHTWSESDPIDEFHQRERCRFGGYNGGKLVPAYSIPVLFFPAVRQCDLSAERFCQMRDGTLTAIALELYRRQHGDWPTSLEQLVPRYLPEAPLDRFTGQTLRYRVNDGRPVVYACGMDQQDDGGRHPSLERGGGDFHQHIFAKTQKTLAPGEGYDWVLFPRPRRGPTEDE